MDMVLDSFEGAMKAFPRTWLRHRIIHCYIVRPEQATRMASLGVIAEVQPGFIADEIDIAESGIPEEMLPISYAWRSLMEAGVLVAGSSDCPRLAKPMGGDRCCCQQGQGMGSHPCRGWFPDQKLTLDETIALLPVIRPFHWGWVNDRDN